MLKATGGLDLVGAVHDVMMENTTIASRGVYLGRAPHDAQMPYVLISIQDDRPTHGLATSELYRTVTLSVKSVAQSSGSVDDFETANTLQAHVHAQLCEDSETETAKARLNRALEIWHWKSGTPIEKSAFNYPDSLGDLERWHAGHLFEFLIART